MHIFMFTPTNKNKPCQTNFFWKKKRDTSNYLPKIGYFLKFTNANLIFCYYRYLPRSITNTRFDYKVGIILTPMFQQNELSRILYMIEIKVGKSYLTKVVEDSMKRTKIKQENKISSFSKPLRNYNDST